ncbi:MAG: hypothetical protein AW07_04334 [Candidatus Accumulibacter sp. SK-11]|nr:MAG: hypothetical protein AW07_04334 [Candidatus Accumulibacter sp. SK-11]
MPRILPRELAHRRPGEGVRTPLPQLGKPRFARGTCQSSLALRLQRSLDVGLHRFERPYTRWPVFDHARGQQGVRSHLDGLRVALVPDRVVREDRCESLGIAQLPQTGHRRRRGIAWQPVRCLQLQLETFGSRLKTVRLLVDDVAEGFGILGKSPLRCLPLQLGLDFRAHLGEAPLLARPDARHHDDVIAELGLHEIGQLVLAQAEDSILERLDHRPARDDAKIAASGCRARILRMLPREIREALGRFPQFIEKLFGSRPGLGLFGIAARHQDQDVTRTPFFALLVAIPVTVVPGLQIGILDRSLADQCIEG